MAIGLDADETVARMLDEPALESRPSMSWLAPLLVAIAVTGTVVTLGWLGWAVTRGGDAPAAVAPHGVPAELPVRRDAVRALAIETGAIAGDGAGAALDPSLELERPSGAGPPASDP